MAHQAMQGKSNTAVRKYRIAIVGAGPGGLCMAIKLLAAGFDDLVLLEREAEVGGTWVNNRYPGLACDVPSVLYSFSFEQKPDWTRSFARQAEIKIYMRHVAEKYGVMPYVRFNTRVQSARWDAAHAHWCLNTDNGETVSAEIFISALGMFNQIQWPQIPGLDDFDGQILHTALWPEGTMLHDRCVAVVGSAASAVQLIPEVAREARRLSVFQRTANWVMPKEEVVYDDAALAELRRDPARAIQARAEHQALLEARIVFDKPELLAKAEQAGLQNLAAVNDPLTREKLKPTVPLGAQRPLYSNDYYSSFNLPHVELVSEPIERLTARGIQTRDGMLREVDTLILATGYAANKFLSVIDVTGRDGLHIKQAWEDGPQAYLGITTSGFPNLFMVYGPNTNNGSILTMIEHQANYIVARLQEMRARALDWIDVRRDVMDRYNEDVQRAIQAVAPWRTLGSKYYRAASGRVVTQWPHNMAAYEALTTAGSLDTFETHGGDVSRPSSAP
ncbi:MAG: flavin-containing monooxygenase [Janthinobacterium lividum]